MMKILKKIIIFGAIALVLYVGYSIFFKADPESTSLLNTRTNTNSGNVLGSEIIKAINEIDSLELDRSVFDDPIFQTLVDRSQELQQQSTGRSNPFAPIGSNDVAPVETPAQTGEEPES